MKHTRWLVVGILVALACASAWAVSSEEELAPREVLKRMYQAMEAYPDKERRANTNPFVERARTEDLDEDERFLLGEAYFVNFMPNEAYELFEPFMDGDGLKARVAWERVMQMEFAAYDRVQNVEEMLPRYKKRFPPAPGDLHGAAYQVQNLANLYRERGDHAAAVEILVEEVRSLPEDAPYRSWLAVPRFMESFEAAGKNEVAVELMERGRKAMLALRGSPAPPVDSDLPEGYYRIEDFFLFEGYHPERSAQWRFDRAVDSVLSGLEAALE